MADESVVELLFKLRAEADTKDLEKAREDAIKLIDAFGKNGQAVGKTTAQFSSLFETLRNKGLETLDKQTQQLARDIPVVGPALSTLTSKVIELGESGKSVRSLQDNLNKVATASGHTTQQVTNFIGSLRGIRDESQRSEQILSFLGQNLATKVSPLLNLAAGAAKAFDQQVVSAGKAAGKTDAEFAKFSEGLLKAQTRTERVAEMVRFLGVEAGTRLAPAMDIAHNAIQKVAQVSNLPVGAIANFVRHFSELGTVAEKNAAAAGFFGEKVAQDVAPALLQAESALATSTGATLAFVNAVNAAGQALGPYGLAIAAAIVQLAAYAVAVGIAIQLTIEIGKQFFEVARTTAVLHNQLFVLAQQTDISVETLSALELALSGVGVSVQGLAQSILQFQRKLEEGKDPLSNAASALKLIGVTSNETEVAFRQAVRGLADLGEGTKQTTLAMQLFGRTGKSLINVIRETGGDIDKVVKRARELGIALSDEAADQAHEFTEAFDALNAQFREMIGNDVVPVVTEAMKQLSQVLIDNKVLIKDLNAILASLAKIFFLSLKPSLDAVLLVLRLFTAQVQLAKNIIEPLVVLLTPWWQAQKKVGEEIDRASGVTTVYTKATKDSTVATKDHSASAVKAAATSKDRAIALGEEITFLQSLAGKTSLSADENRRLEETYKSLSPAARNRIKEIKEETERTEELIKVKQKQKEQAESEDAEELDRKRLASAQFNIDNIVAQAKATIDAAKNEEAVAQQNFEAGRLRSDQLRDIQRRTAETIVESTKFIADEQEKLAEKTFQVSEKSLKDEKVINDARHKARLEREEADRQFLIRKSQIEDEFTKRQQGIEKERGQSSLRTLEQNLARTKQLVADQLKTGADATKQIFAVQANGIEILKSHKTLIEDVLKRTNITIETRKQFSDELARIDRDILEQQKTFSAQYINELIESNAKQKRIADETIKIQEDEVRKQRRIFLERQTTIGSQPDREAARLALKEFDNETIAFQEEQVRRRRQIDIDERNQKIAILVNTATTSVQLFEQAQAQTTESLRRQADERIITEESAATRIIAIRQRVINAQLELLEIERSAAQESLKEDPAALASKLQELEQRRQVLLAQRKTIIENSVIEIEEARQRDIDNERDYQDEITRLESRSNRARLDVARATLALLRARGANRRDILGAQAAIEIAEENQRHEQRKKELDKEKELLNDRIDFFTRYIAALKAAHQEESDSYIKANEELEKANKKRDELNKEEEAESQEHRVRRRIIERPLEVETEREDPVSKRSLFGDNFANNLANIKRAAEEAGESIGGLEANFKAAAQTALDFFETQSEAAGNFGTIASNAFNGLANAVGSLVENYVLMGETGPAALRKLLAATLASIAAEATVKAIFELAAGFAALFINPAAAAGHFTSAALYGSIAGASAIAGRKLAGDLFKGNQSAGTTPGTDNRPAELNPITLGRNQTQPTQPQVVKHEHVLRVETNDSHIVSVVGRNWRESGEIRELVFEDR